MIAVLMLVPAMSPGILLRGCATTGDTKDVGAEAEFSQTAGAGEKARQAVESPTSRDEQSTAVVQTNGGSAGVRKEPDVY